MRKINKVLIANRGEIAVRIINTLQKLNISSVAVYASDDASGLHVKMADEKVLLQGTSLSETYLNIQQLIHIASQVNADAVHPGYGFLSENPDFAKACELNGFTFIGPTPEAIQLMGNKVAARKFVKSIGVPIIEGMTIETSEILDLKDQLSFPLIIKAAAGGGGKGMRIVRTRENLAADLYESQRQVKNYFGNGQVYIEKYIEDPRHIEVQLLSDQYGNHIHLFERECSLQRRYQKIIEEAPAVSVRQETRKKLHEAAISIATAMNYQSAGTIEFLVDKQEHIYFLEMNTRIQVEHPVTEAVTGIDIVKAQVNIAEGEKLPFLQENIKPAGHAIEARVYAEDPSRNFMPAPGQIDYIHFPDHKDVRIDKGHEDAFQVSAKYDPLIAKVISHGNTRDEAITKLSGAIDKIAIHGIKNNVAYLKYLLSIDEFLKNNISTQYLENEHQKVISNMESVATENNLKMAFLAAYLWDSYHGTTENDPWKSAGRWRNFHCIPFQINERMHQLKIIRISHNKAYLLNGQVIGFKINGNVVELNQNQEKQEIFISHADDRSFYITFDGYTWKAKRRDMLNETGDEDNYKHQNTSAKSSSGHVLSPMNGTAVKVLVKNGRRVKKGEILLVIESMKMENKILSLDDGIVHGLKIKKGQQVRGNEILMYIKQEIESNEFK